MKSTDRIIRSISLKVEEKVGFSDEGRIRYAVRRLRLPRAIIPVRLVMKDFIYYSHPTGKFHNE